jgi:lactoylglutathione lyase
MLEIVKNQLDFGLLTYDAELPAFWEGEVGLRLDHVLPVRRGQDQHRFDLAGSVIKVNLLTRRGSSPDPGAPEESAARSGYEELLIAKPGTGAPRAMTDPDGNALRFVEPGDEGVTQMGVRLAVPDLARSLAHYRDVLGFTQEAPGRVRCGDSVILIEERADAPTGKRPIGLGWTYLTVQVRDCDAEVARIEALGAQVATRPVNLGEVARMAMVSDPDGNLLEISQRASLTGPLPSKE